MKVLYKGKHAEFVTDGHNIYYSFDRLKTLTLYLAVRCVNGKGMSSHVILVRWKCNSCFFSRNFGFDLSIPMAIPYTIIRFCDNDHGYILYIFLCVCLGWGVVVRIAEIFAVKTLLCLHLTLIMCCLSLRRGSMIKWISATQKMWGHAEHPICKRGLGRNVTCKIECMDVRNLEKKYNDKDIEYIQMNVHCNKWIQK